MKENKFYGIIGNGHTCALINPIGSIEWFCFPRFDSGFVFGRIIDEKSGFWSIQPLDTEIKTCKQNYVRDTAILETKLFDRNEEMICKITDWMPQCKNEIRRTISTHDELSKIDINFKLKPTFDYRRETHKWSYTTQLMNDIEFVIFTAKSKIGQLSIIIPKKIILTPISKLFNLKSPNMSLELTLRISKTCDIILFYEDSENLLDITKLSDYELTSEISLDREKRFWSDWLQISDYTGSYQQEFRRSLITMKLLTYRPTGALIAASTTSIPQHLGGGGNWDYRFCWIRDGVYGAAAYLEAGYIEESRSCLDFMFSVMFKPDTKPWQPLYRIDGSPDCTEEILNHLSGYFGDGPVRIGNLAYTQVQNDLEGEVIEVAWLFYEYTKEKAFLEKYWNKILSVVKYVEKHWQEKDSGIWELRVILGDYVHSKVMCWVVFDRAIKIAEVLGHIDVIEKWKNICNEIRKEIYSNGWNRKLKSFTLAYKTPIIDSSTLQLPLTGFLIPNEDYNIKMIKRIEDELVYDNLVARNIVETAPFPLVTFWLARTYILMGEIIKAQNIIDRSIGLLTDLNLYCEHAVSAKDQPKPSFGTILKAIIHLFTAHENRSSRKEFFRMLKQFYKHSFNYKESFPTPKINKEQQLLFKGNFPQLYSHEELIRSLISLEKLKT